MIREAPATSVRRFHISDKPSSLAEICNDNVNLAIWGRVLDGMIVSAAQSVITHKPHFELVTIVQPHEVVQRLSQDLGNRVELSSLYSDVAYLVEMFCFLFNLDAAGLRMTVLNKAMCPRFHVDRVPCRLITTYNGVATDWLPEHSVDRTKLGKGNNGLPDDESGIYQNEQDIMTLDTGAVALFKGENWSGNQGYGLVHRSPKPPQGKHRLVMTLDFV